MISSGLLLWNDCNAGRQSTKGKSQSVFACLRSLANLARHREFVKAICHLLFIRPPVVGVLFYLCERANDIAIRRLFRGIGCSGSGVDRISLVIYSMRVGDVPPSFAVILAVPCHEDTRHEGTAKVKARERYSETSERYDKYNIFSTGERNMLTKTYTLYKLPFI